MTRRTPASTLFPYTTLFRSVVAAALAHPRMFTQELGCHHAVLQDRKSTRLNSSHVASSYAVFCLKKKTPCQLRRPEECYGSSRSWSPQSRPVSVKPRPHASS